MARQRFSSIRWLGKGGQRLALVERARDPRRERVEEGGERLRLAELRLAVADPDLDGREGQMRTDAPPDLGVLGDRAGLVEVADVALVLVPAGERVRDAAAREHPREDLRARRVEVCEALLDERRARGDGEELGQEAAERARDADGAVGAADGRVDVEAERVVAPDDVAEDLVVAPVVRRVDDPLLLPGAPGVRPGRCQPDAALRREAEEAQAGVVLPGDRVGEGRPLSRPDLDLGRDQLSGDRVRERRVRAGGILELFEPLDEVERVGIEDLELLLDPDREVLGVLEDLADAVHVEHQVR
jgi:hypothetical protein